MMEIKNIFLLLLFKYDKLDPVLLKIDVKQPSL